MNNDAEVRNRILSKANEMFQSYGFSKVTMEEIAADLGISKKTLYKHFSNKEHLLKEIVNNAKCEIEVYVNKLIEDKETEFIAKLQNFMAFVVSHFSRLSNPIVQDLVKNQPEVWKEIQDFRKKNAHDCFSRLINQGVKNGIFRDDLDTEVVTMLYFSAVNSMLNLETLSKLPVTANEAYKILVRVLFEGIFTSEGRKKFKNKIR
jgi:AcrR family transcriptional regulator